MYPIRITLLHHLVMTSTKQSAFEVDITAVCTNYKKVHGRDDEYRACATVFVGTDYFSSVPSPTETCLSWGGCVLPNITWLVNDGLQVQSIRRWTLVELVTQSKISNDEPHISSQHIVLLQLYKCYPTPYPFQSLPRLVIPCMKLSFLDMIITSFSRLGLISLFFSHWDRNISDTRPFVEHVQETEML